METATALPRSGWELRVGRGSGDRPALEVHSGDGLIEGAVAGGRGAVRVRGAVRGREFSVAWGQLPAGGEVLVEFRAGGSSHKVPAITVAGEFWVVVVFGCFCVVVVTTTDERRDKRQFF